MPKVVAITGATGFLGSVLVDYFLDKDWKVVSLARTPNAKSHKNLSSRTYDLGQPVKASLLSDVDYLIHAAYVKASDNAEALDVNIEGAKNLVDALQKSQVKQSIFISSMSSHEEAISIYGKQKLTIEKAFSALKTSTIVRPGLIVGNGGIVKEMGDIMKSKHVVPVVDGGNQPLQIINVYDLATALYNILEKSLYGRFVVATSEVYKYKDFYKALAKHLDTKVLYIPVPYIALMSVFKVVALLPIKLGVGEDNLKGLKKLISMESASDLKKIGLKPLNLSEALARTK